MCTRRSPKIQNTKYTLTVRTLFLNNPLQDPIECLIQHLSCPHFDIKELACLNGKGSVGRLFPIMSFPYRVSLTEIAYIEQNGTQSQQRQRQREV